LLTCTDIRLWTLRFDKIFVTIRNAGEHAEKRHLQASLALEEPYSLVATLDPAGTVVEHRIEAAAIAFILIQGPLFLRIFSVKSGGKLMGEGECVSSDSVVRLRWLLQRDDPANQKC
jgi:hypothetical protein